MQFVRTIMVNKSVENRANWSGGGIKWGFHWYSSEKRRWVPILFYFIFGDCEDFGTRDYTWKTGTSLCGSHIIFHIQNSSRSLLPTKLMLWSSMGPFCGLWELMKIMKWNEWNGIEISPFFPFYWGRWVTVSFELKSFNGCPFTWKKFLYCGAH